MIPLDLDAMEAAAQRLLTAHGLTVDGTGDNDRVISPAITSARDVLALAAALRTERAAREAAHAHHAAIAGAVRAEREAERGHAAVRADDASRGRHLRAAEAAVDKARHATDAILSAAPARSTVDARVVREVIAARAALIAVSSERRDVWTRVDHGQRENAASARLVAAEAALDAALAGCA